MEVSHMGNIQLAKNLYTLRKSNKLTQDHVGDLLSVSRQAYSHYETNKRTPDLDSLIILSQLYNVSLDQLVNHYITDTIRESKGPYTPGLNIGTGDTLYLSEAEVELLMNFRGLSDDNQQILQGFITSHSK